LSKREATHYKHCEQIPWKDTALAANDLANRKLKPKSAVIAHEECAQHYGLSIIDNDIQDLKHNDTLFLIITGGNN